MAKEANSFSTDERTEMREHFDQVCKLHTYARDTAATAVAGDAWATAAHAHPPTTVSVHRGSAPNANGAAVRGAIFREPPGV
jgi:hypothetical protein